jgi:glyoxylase-like metal-dependent hydrolase (beta-lactamase superfamily II)
MARWICTACGTQFPEAATPPTVCPICDDDREPPNPNDVAWTTLADLVATDRRVRVVEHEPGLTGIGTEPGFGIGQRPILARTPSGNVLWDCMAWLDDEVEQAVRQRGGLSAIAISHPHFHTTMTEWADRFDVPVWLHEDDRPWVMRPSGRVRFWAGETHPLLPGATVVRLGGHFPGSTVLHWEHAADRRGVLLTGDTIMPVPAAGWATFLYSYPNSLPLPAAEVRRIRDAVAPYAYDRLYAAWFGQELIGGADRAVQESADRYLAKLAGHVTVAPGVEGSSTSAARGRPPR